MNSPKTIRALVVDDSVVIRRLMSIVLDKMGLGADYVDNGIKALSMLQDETYDIVFLDIMMDGMDGYKVCKLIKSDEKTRDIPVIMLTSRDGRIDKIRGKMAGADHYLTKPVKMSEFKKTVESFLPITADLEKMKSQQEAPASRPPLTSPAKLKSVPVKPSQLDKSKALETAETHKNNSLDNSKRTAKEASVAKQDEPLNSNNSQTQETPKKPDLQQEMSREEKIARIREMMRK